MSRDEIREEFTATHHALLFAWISRAVIQYVGEEQGETIIRKAIRRYGEQRGRRMALSAQANGHTLSMANYMAYSEWRAGEDETEREMDGRALDARTLVYRCPWNKAWRDQNLIPYGRLYCLEIDEALVRGFNPELKLDVNSTLTNDAPYCEFVYHDANLATVKADAPGENTVMPWDYHLGHLRKTAGEVIIEELGHVGQEAINTALAEFAQCYGEGTAQIVAAYQDTDFNHLPE